jgi:glycogen debranching enzyme/glycosidase
MAAPLPHPIMVPAPGERLVRFVGDRLRFEVRDARQAAPPANWAARLRTNLGRGAAVRREIIEAQAKGAPPAGASWCDMPMERGDHGWSLEVPLTEVGFFRAKAYLLDHRGWQHWPEGHDFGVSVHPDWARTANTIYCAFPRLHGASKTARSTRDPVREGRLRELDAAGYTVIPPSGKLRDLIPQLPHITRTLGCRILHLLPIGPTPTTYARFGRFGSPYACLDLTAVDPALVEFDRRTTGVEQFLELAHATHRHGARLFLDIVINHTGWGSTLQENHPQWFVRKPGGEFHSPGAWGTTWEDLVELRQDSVALWDVIADSLLVWCRRGVDGFRCDAGYMVPVPAWQYIIARVREEFPDVVFLLEGLGGAWEATEALVTHGGMQWAYSELFQNYSAAQVNGYLDHAFQQCARVGTLIHYSETHDNDRLAAWKSDPGQASSQGEGRSPAASSGRRWSLLRNRLCGLTSVSGGFGFTAGVEWLADEKIRVHDCTGLNWGAAENIVAELGQLNHLLATHPCFFDGAKLTRLNPGDADLLALLRESAEGKDVVLVLVNLSPDQPRTLSLAASQLPPAFSGLFLHHSGARVPATPPFRGHELLGQPLPEISVGPGMVTFTLAPAAAHCLAPTAEPVGLAGDAYRAARARAAWAVQALSRTRPPEEMDGFDWRALAAAVDRSPREFLVNAGFPAPEAKLESPGERFPNVIEWTIADARRMTPVPPRHWVLFTDDAPFRLTVEVRRAEPETRRAPASGLRHHLRSIPAAGRHIACWPPHTDEAADATLTLERFTEHGSAVTAELRLLPSTPLLASRVPRPTDLALLTNGRGAMARLCADLGRVTSKYDCVLGANLHPTLPVDRHIFAKRLRVWINADGFITPLDFHNLARFTPGPPAIWHFVAQAGDGRTVEVQLTADLLPGRNTTVFCFSRPSVREARGKQLPDNADVRLTVRVDIEDRNFHSETQHNVGANHHFTSHCRPFTHHASHIPSGFRFTPATDRHLRVYATAGEYHPSPEWSIGIPHPVEASRGQVPAGDAFSPGWFELPLGKGMHVGLIVTAEAADPTTAELEEFKARAHRLGSECAASLEGGTEGRPACAGAAERNAPAPAPVCDAAGDPEEAFTARLIRAARAFVVRRGEGKTVIAGYPWFLDWGRDTLLCARGLLAAGMAEEVREILLTFARFEEHGTLPNIIHGDHIGNRDTSDAPLWFGVACEDFSRLTHDASRIHEFYSAPVDSRRRTLADVLRSIAAGYLAGTPNGIRVDAASGLVFSPSHFTWMDTNHPAGTPREGYPIEIQCLWIRLLRQLARLDAEPVNEPWSALAERALASLEKLFWLEEGGWFADCLRAAPGTPAASAQADDALRSNCLFAVSLGLVAGDRARRTVEAARRWLVVPGGLRSLAPLPVKLPLEIRHHGRLLNDPHHPYWGRYEGDEDTQRKPAYHNGTAWTWMLPVFCEALAVAWDHSPEAVAAARAYLLSSQRLLDEGCLGHLPEVLDGDAPHTPRGCDAQAWSVTETLRVWRLLRRS